MKFIDDKGRIFGIINVIDLIALLMLAGVVSMIYVGYKVMMTRNVVENEVWVNVRVRSEDIISELADAVTEGDVSRDAFDKVIARIRKIESRKPVEAFIVMRDQSPVAFNRYLKKDVLLSLEILCESNGKVIYHKDNPVKIGSSITFITDNYDISGLVIGLEK